MSVILSEIYLDDSVLHIVYFFWNLSPIFFFFFTRLGASTLIMHFFSFVFHMFYESWWGWGAGLIFYLFIPLLSRTYMKGLKQRCHALLSHTKT